MRDLVTIDVRAMWATLQATPDKGFSGRSRTLSNEEEWIIWLTWGRKRQKAVASTLRMCADTVQKHYKRLESQDGPKGKMPEWMK